MMSVLKKMIDEMPEERIKILFVFTQWLLGEELGPDELDIVKRGEKKIKEGKFVRNRM